MWHIFIDLSQKRWLLTGLPSKPGWKIWWKKLFITMSKLEPLTIKIRNHALICHGGQIQGLFEQFSFKNYYKSKRKVGLLIILPSIYCLLLSTYSTIFKTLYWQNTWHQRFHKCNQNIAWDASPSLRTDLKMSTNSQIHLMFGGVEVTMNSW